MADNPYDKFRPALPPSGDGQNPYAKFQSANAATPGQSQAQTHAAPGPTISKEEQQLAIDQMPNVIRFNSDPYSPFYRAPGSPEVGKPIPFQELGGAKRTGGMTELEEVGHRVIDGVIQDAGYVSKYLLGQPTWFKAIDENIAARRLQFVKDHPLSDPTSLDIAAGLVPIVPVTALRATKLISPAYKGVRAAVSAGAAGALTGSAQYAPTPEDKQSQIEWAAAAGAAPQAIAGAYPAVKNVLARILDSTKTQRTQELVQVGKDFLTHEAQGFAPAPYTLSQETGNPVLGRLQAQAYGGNLQEMNARQLDQTAAEFMHTAKQAEQLNALAHSPTSANVAYGLHRAVDAADQSLTSQKSNFWKTGMSQVTDLSNRSSVRVKLSNLQDAYENIIAQDSNAFNWQGTTLPAQVKDSLKAVTELNANGGVAKIAGLQHIMQGITQDVPRGNVVLTPTEARAMVYRGQLRDALNSDIQEAMKQDGIKSDPALQKLDYVRNVYAQLSQHHDRLAADAITNIFGDPVKAMANPAAGIKALLALHPDDQQFAMTLLDQYAPKTKAALGAYRIQEAIKSAAFNGAAKNSKFDLAGFNADMFEGRNGDITNALLDPVTQAKMKQGAAHLSVLLNDIKAGPGLTQSIDNLVMTAASMSPPFLARVVSRAAYGTYGDKLLGTDEGLKALRTLTDVRQLKTQAGAEALALIISVAKANEQAAAPPPSK